MTAATGRRVSGQPTPARAGRSRGDPASGTARAREAPEAEAAAIDRAGETTADQPNGERYVSVRGVRLRVRITGSGQPMLLINGLGACLESWRPVEQRLQGRRLVMVDHPGTGLSQPLDMPLGMADIAAMYAEVLDRLGLGAVDVLGFSFGGAVAQQMAHDFPRRVRSLVLISTACGWGGLPAEPLSLLAAANPMCSGSRQLRELSASLIYRGRAGRHPELFESELREMDAHHASVTAVMWQVAAYATWSSLPWLWSLKVPTLVLGGRDDPVAPAANSTLLATFIPRAELHILPDGGHLMLFDRADDILPLIDDFLRARTAAAA